MSADTKSYKDTLNLPKTDFPMKAALVQREPERLKQWEERSLYEEVQTARAGAETFTLHDGPPFANGDIHLGHLINKTLKDVVLRYQTMKGRRTPYVPGWDCHGLPIEHKVQEKLGPKLRELDTLTVRRLCREHAEKFVDRQRGQFKRLGILGDWDRPYATMTADYEAATLDVFSQFVGRGLVYKKLKPVHWSLANRTALADAELEYQRVRDPSVFVEFPVLNPGAVKAKLGLREPGRVGFLIWTTTPWTLPANLAIAVNAGESYDVVRYDRPGEAHPRVLVVANALREKVFAAGGSKGEPPEDLGDDDWKGTKQFFNGESGRAARGRGDGARRGTVEPGVRPPVRAQPRRADPGRRLRHDDRRHGPGPHRPRPRRGGLRDGPKARPRRLLPRASGRAVRLDDAAVRHGAERVGGEPGHRREAG